MKLGIEYCFYLEREYAFFSSVNQLNVVGLCCFMGSKFASLILRQHLLKAVLGGFDYKK